MHTFKPEVGFYIQIVSFTQIHQVSWNPKSLYKWSSPFSQNSDMISESWMNIHVQSYYNGFRFTNDTYKGKHVNEFERKIVHSNENNKEWTIILTLIQNGMLMDNFCHRFEWYAKQSNLTIVCFIL